MVFQASLTATCRSLVPAGRPGAEIPLQSGVKSYLFRDCRRRGLIQGDHPSRWPDKFNSTPGMIFPVFHLFKYLLHDKSFKVIRSLSSNPLKVDVLTLSDGNHIKIIVINFTTERQEIIFTGISGEFTIKQLNTESFADATADPEWVKNSSKAGVRFDDKICLEPFSLSFIDNLP
jgi:hypothetical protein